MTEPTDAEIDALWRFEASKNWDSTLAMRTSFARAVLAKFGTPPAMAGQLADEQIEDLLECGNPTDDEKRLVRMGWDAARNAPPAQAQAAPQSGAKSFQTYAEANAYSRGYYAGKKAATQAQAGAVPLTDAQSHALIERMANEAEQWAEGLSYEPTQEQLSGLCVAFIQREIHFAHGIKQGGQHG